MGKSFINSIGTVIPLGDGGAGKSILMRHLIDKTKSQEDALKLIQTIKKSLNVELEYDTKILEFEEKIVSTALEYYVFPGQKQKTSTTARTFEETVAIYDFLPAFKKISVILMVYDTSNIDSLKSLEHWLLTALSKGWITDQTKIILVSNKIDIQLPDSALIGAVKERMVSIINEAGISFSESQISNVETSAASLEGIEKLRDEIFEWVAHYGLQRKKTPLPTIPKKNNVELKKMNLQTLKQKYSFT